MRKAKKKPTKQTKTSRCNWQKKIFASAAIFLVHFLAVVVATSVKLLSYTFYGENVVCAHKKFCCLCSCSLFFTAPHFCLTVGSQF